MAKAGSDVEGLSVAELELIVAAGPHVPNSAKKAARAILLAGLATDTEALMKALDQRSAALRAAVTQLTALKAYLDGSPFDELAAQVTRVLDKARVAIDGTAPGGGAARARSKAPARKVPTKKPSPRKDPTKKSPTRKARTQKTPTRKAPTTRSGLTALQDPRIRKVLSLTSNDTHWQADLAKLQKGDATLTRRTASEPAVKALQRLMVFLGYSTGSGGGFGIDGDFGRGTNRGIAQFQVEHGLSSAASRELLTYACNGPSSSKSNIVTVPEVKLDMATVEAMLQAALEAIDSKQVTFGDFDDAIFHLNALDRGASLSRKQILDKYGGAASRAVKTVSEETGVDVNRKWVLCIIRQESAGVVRPRFEQHHLSKYNKQTPDADLGELRLRSMSMGLGQVMGSNHAAIGADSPRAMLTSPADDQVLFIARFLARARNKGALATDHPSAQDYIDIASFYNGRGFAQNHYNEHLENSFLDFSRLMT